MFEKVIFNLTDQSDLEDVLKPKMFHIWAFLFVLNAIIVEIVTLAVISSLGYAEYRAFQSGLPLFRFVLSWPFERLVPIGLSLFVVYLSFLAFKITIGSCKSWLLGIIALILNVGLLGYTSFIVNTVPVFQTSSWINFGLQLFFKYSYFVYGLLGLLLIILIASFKTFNFHNRSLHPEQYMLLHKLVTYLVAPLTFIIAYGSYKILTTFGQIIIW